MIEFGYTSEYEACRPGGLLGCNPLSAKALTTGLIDIISVREGQLVFRGSETGIGTVNRRPELTESMSLRRITDGVPYDLVSIIESWAADLLSLDGAMIHVKKINEKRLDALFIKGAALTTVLQENLFRVGQPYSSLVKAFKVIELAVTDVVFKKMY